MHPLKKGLRALGIAESYTGRTISTLAGVVMRKDLRIDGFCFGNVTVGGMDATDTIIGMVQSLQRRDLNVILLFGCVISWFNIIDPERIAEKSGFPVICVTYEASDELAEDIMHHYPQDYARIEAYKKLGERTFARLHTNQTIFLRTWVLSTDNAVKFCNDFTLEGGIPEPLRVAHLCARNIFSYHNTRCKSD